VPGNKKPWRTSAIAGGFIGLTAWLTYAVVEFILSVTIPRLQSDQWELLPWQWPLVALLFGFYALVGLVSGGLGSLCLALAGRKPSAEDHRSLACLTISAAFVANLLPGRHRVASEDLALAVAVALCVILCGTLFGKIHWRVAWLASPALVSVLLLIGPWMAREILSAHSEVFVTAAAVGAMTAVLGVATLGGRLFQGKRVYGAVRAMAGTAAVVISVMPFLHGTASFGKAEVAGSSPSGKPNVVLITMDTVRADHVSAYGYERDTTPNLRAFAQEAAVYDRAIATESYTLPTHASMFTGLYPRWNGAIRTPQRPEGAPIGHEVPTLATVLREHGYWTAETVANFAYLGHWSGLTEGFSSDQVKAAVKLCDIGRPFYLRESAVRLIRTVWRSDDFWQDYLRAPDLNRDAFAILDQAGAQHMPFFLFVNYMDAHALYLPVQPFRDRFGPFNADLASIASAKGFVAVKDAVNAGRRSLDEREKRYLTSQYDAGIAMVDDSIGKLLTRLRERGLYENTLVLITADHGEAIGDHNFMTHGLGSVYQDQIRIPLLVKYPRQHAASRTAALVSQVDYMPTILEAAGISAPRGLQGQSLRSAREDSGAVFAESDAPRALGQNPKLRGTRRAVFSGQWKLIAWSDGPPELYDLAGDPNEMHNRYQPDDTVAAALFERIQKWSAMPQRKPMSTQETIDRKDLEKLKSLGYVQ
jgi:arylsulfatase A-like enzyme